MITVSFKKKLLWIEHNALKPGFVHSCSTVYSTISKPVYKLN